MPPADSTLPLQILEQFVSSISALNPATNTDVWQLFDHVSIEDPPPERFLDRAVAVPETFKRLCFVWRDEDAQEEGQSGGRNYGTLAVIVTALERYKHIDINPFLADERPSDFISRTEARDRMESDLKIALADLHAGGLARNAQIVSTRVPQIGTSFDGEWIEVELMFDVFYQYQRAKPWLK